MAMSMLASFFDIEKDSMIMFDGLKVAKNNKMLCEKWMNQCPVIFLSFKDVDGRTFENAFELLKFTSVTELISQKKEGERSCQRKK